VPDEHPTPHHYQIIPLNNNEDIVRIQHLGDQSNSESNEVAGVKYVHITHPRPILPARTQPTDEKLQKVQVSTSTEYSTYERPKHELRPKKEDDSNVDFRPIVFPVNWLSPRTTHPDEILMPDSSFNAENSPPIFPGSSIHIRKILDFKENPEMQKELEQRRLGWPSSKIP